MNLASALEHAAILGALCRRPEAARDFVALGIEVTARKRIALFHPLALFFHGVALSEQGDVDAGLSEMMGSH